MGRAARGRAVAAPARTERQVLDDVARVREDAAALECRQRELVAEARALGTSWAVLGRYLGRTGQAVSMRYGGRSG